MPRAFFERPVLEVARDLLGRHLWANGVTVRLTEVEAYAGEVDPASHAFRGRTARNATMFGPAGHAYVYFTYGMHHCMNLVTGPEGTARAVLLRAGEVIGGLDAARGRRVGASDRDLCRGPARLTRALAVDRAFDGVDVCDADSAVRLLACPPAPPPAVLTGPRVGVAAGADAPWRFWLDGDRTVSPYRPATPRGRRR